MAANYLRCPTKDTYLVCKRDTRNITMIRQRYFVLKLETEQKREKQLAHQQRQDQH